MIAPSVPTDSAEAALVPHRGSATQRTTAASGFSLLEMMIAISLLAVSLLAIINATSNAITAENHAKLMTTATFLARQRLVELEERYLEKGPTDSEVEGEKSGDFDDDGFKRFKWETKVVKSEHLGEIMETLTAFAGDSKSGGPGGGSGSPPPEGRYWGCSWLSA